MELKLTQRNGAWRAAVTIAEFEDTRECDRIYDKHVLSAKCTLYRSIDQHGICKYYSHITGNETGFGGHIFKLNVHDDSGMHIEEIKGPWSSRASVMNIFFTPHIVDCEVRGPRFCDTRGVTVETLEPLLAKLGASLECTQDGYGEITYNIIPITA